MNLAKAKSKSFEGKYVVLEESCLNEREKSQENPEIFQIYLATGGSGCHPNNIGSKVFAEQIATGKATYFRRHNVAGLATKKQVKASQKFKETTKLYRDISLDTVQFDENGDAYIEITDTFRYDVSLLVSKTGVGHAMDMSLDVDDSVSSGSYVLDSLDSLFRQKHREVDEALDKLGYKFSNMDLDPDDETLNAVWNTIREVKDLLSVQPTRKECVPHLENYARIWLAARLNLETLPPSIKVDLDNLPEEVIKDLAEKSPRVREFAERDTPEE